MFKKISFLLLLLLMGVSFASAHGLKGTVYDEKGEPLVGATVLIANTQKAVFTKEDGVFYFRDFPHGDQKITVSFIGYVNNTQPVNVDEESRAPLKFEMKPSTELTEIEVFGDRFKQPEKLETITRMPLRPSEQIQSISVISEKLISQQGVLTITDAVRNVPGVTLFGSYGGVKESMSSRGFRGIPVLKNGVRIDSQFQTASGIADMQGVESIQMIKGSAAITQGVITDLGNAGGVINVVTKTPKFVNAGEVGLRVGSWGQVRPTFDVQTVLDKDRTLAIRLNGAYERADSYRSVVSSNRVYVNPSLEWRPDSKTTVNLEMDYLNEDRTPVTSTVNLASIETEALYEMPYNKFLGLNIENVNTKILTYSLRANRQITDKLSVRAAYFNSAYNVDNTSTALGEAVKGVYDEHKTRTLSRSLRDDKNTTFQLDFIGRDVYTGPIKHTFQVGFDYRLADALTTNLGTMKLGVINVLGDVSNTPPAKIELTFDPPKATEQNPYPVAPTSVPPVQAKYTTYGLMAQEVMTINDYLKVILAVRYSSISITAAAPAAGLNTRDAWDPLFGLVISPLKNVNVTVSYTTSTSLRSAAQILEDKVTEAGASTTKQFEAGIKSDWLDNRLRFNFTYFNILTDNLTNSEYFPSSNQTTGYYFKAGDLKRQGVEVELSGRVMDNLELILGYAYLDAQYKNSPSYVNGSALMNAPTHTANAWAQYTLDRTALKGLSIGIGAYYVGERPVNEWSLKPDGHGTPVGSKPFDMPAYTTINAQLGYTYQKVTTRVFFNNIFDALGYNSYYRGGYINQIDPRNFSVAVSYKF